MSDTTFVDYSTPAVSAEWLNEVNDHLWSDTPVSGVTVHAAGVISNTPAGNIVATTVQAAINELDSDKEPADATILKDADIGVNVQAYDADTAKYDDTTANFTGNLQEAGVDVVTAGAVTSSGLTQATSKVLGRTTASTGAIEELTLSQVLDLIGSAAQGDILYRDAAGWARLGAGTSGDFLKTQGAAANPIWATIAASGLSSKFVSATRDISLASGTQAITGAGFQPTACILLAAVSGTAFYSTGIADSATSVGSLDFAGGTYNATLNLARVGAAGGRADAVVTSWDADGVTLTWTKVSSPTGTASLYFLFLK